MEEKNTLYLTTGERDLQIAAELLRQGGTVIFPTETVYGLGANALDAQAAEKIFAAKGRPADNPLIVHIAERSALEGVAASVPDRAKRLMDAFWPGPLTLILPRAAQVPKAVTGGLDTVAVRMPSQPVARRLLALAGVPVAAPSANLSGKPSPTSFRHVREDMDGRVDAVIDGGDCAVGVESTVLDLTGERPVLFRPGGVTLEQIEAVTGPVDVVTKAAEGESPRSPGLKYKHYAPNAEVRILHGSVEQVRDYAEEQCAKGRTGMLVFDELPDLGGALITRSLGSRTRPEEAAHRLFTVLRELDAEGVSVILAPEIPESGVWRAVRNRLYRAAGERIVDLTQKRGQEILAVCTGNTCRSPMAEGILREMARQAEREIRVSSAGLYADGAPVSAHAAAALAEKGIDISGHRARQLTPDMARSADLILTMTGAHRQMLAAALPDAADKVFTLAQWAGEDGDVLDPFGGSLEQYRACRDQIWELLRKGWEKNL